MTFTVHPEQKPSDNDKYWKKYYEEHNALAAHECNLHAENVRVARALEN